MTAENGSFILLQDGKVNVYTSNYEVVIERLNAQYKKNPASDFIITQVVGTVDKPTKPTVHSVYGANL